MSLRDVKALTFDTGGTILDWHSGIKRALQRAGQRHGVTQDWAGLTNKFRYKSLMAMLNHGATEPASKNFDDVHEETLDDLLCEHDLEIFDTDDRRRIWWDAIHQLDCWPDFLEILPRLRNDYLCVSFTILSFRIIIDTARHNGLHWDAVLSCETIGKYKVLPESYQACAKFLQLPPHQICMVATHTGDLDAAAEQGFRTALVRRAKEWGPAPQPAPETSHSPDIDVDNYHDLAEALDRA